MGPCCRPRITPPDRQISTQCVRDQLGLLAVPRYACTGYETHTEERFPWGKAVSAPVGCVHGIRDAYCGANSWGKAVSAPGVCVQGVRDAYCGAVFRGKDCFCLRDMCMAEFSRILRKKRCVVWRWVISGPPAGVLGGLLLPAQDSPSGPQPHRTARSDSWHFRGMRAGGSRRILWSSFPRRGGFCRRGMRVQGTRRILWSGFPGKRLFSSPRYVYGGV